MNTPKKEKTFFEKYDLYSDANPSETVRVKYDNIKNLNKTISKIESLYKKNKITHPRAVQIANVITQRLRVIFDNTGKAKNRFDRSKKYFEFLKKRTKLSEEKRKKFIFK